MTSIDLLGNDLVLAVLAASDPGMLLSIFASLWNILQVLIGLGFVIFVHELGHFLAAKAFGVKCEKFYVGFDVPIRIGPIRLPSNLGKFQWGETEYGIGILPLGGYVKMLGQDDDPRKAEAEAERIRQAKSESSLAGESTYQLDPRSFPAKPVFARMVIISAGVVMNLIFAVIMAAGAFMAGVPYQPTIVGNVTAGDPAWQNGIQPGDKIVQVGSMTKPDNNLTFEDMIIEMMTFGIDDAKRPVTIVLERDGETKKLSMVGTTSHDPKNKRLTIGVVPEHSTRLSRDIVYLTEGIGLRGRKKPDLASMDQSKLLPTDLVVGVDGQMLTAYPGTGEPMARDVTRRLFEKLDQPVLLQVDRKVGASTKRVEVQLPPTPMRSLGGLRLQLGSVSAIQIDSLAAQAGVKVGDRLIAFDGQPIEDGLTLHLAVARKRGNKVTLQLERGKTDAGTQGDSSVPEKYEFSWDVPAHPNFTKTTSDRAPVGFELVGSGLSYNVESTIAKISPDSQAAKAGMLAGDRLVQVELQPTSDKQKQDLIESLSKVFRAPIKIDASHNPLWLHESVQVLPLDLPIKVFLERDGKTREAIVQVETNKDGWHWCDRGLAFEPMQMIRKTDSVAEAFVLGLGETKKRLWSVVDFLRLAVTGKVPLNNFGGPGVIFYVASSAASEGWTKLLMFLTLLSANLAILNFLPIPALDGGHMMFLIAEAVRGKPVDENLQMRLTMAGVLGLLALMAFVIVNDAINLSQLFG